MSGPWREYGAPGEPSPPLPHTHPPKVGVMDELREALTAYRANPVNVDDDPESWALLDQLLDACDAALATADKPLTGRERDDQPWPISSVVRTLADFADHALEHHGCDRIGYERAMQARDVGREWLAATPTAPALDVGLRKAQTAATLYATNGDPERAWSVLHRAIDSALAVKPGDDIGAKKWDAALSPTTETPE